MATDPYSADDLFESENDQAFLDNQDKSQKTDDYDAFEPHDDPLTASALDPNTESVEDRIIREKGKDKRRLDIDDTRYIRKEIEDAKKELAKQRYDYKKLTPRCLRAYVYCYQEAALQGKTPGLRSEKDPNLLLVPVIENDGERDIVVLRAPVVGSLERHLLLPDSDIVKTLQEYHADQDK